MLYNNSSLLSISNSSRTCCFCSAFKKMLAATVSINLSTFSISPRDTNISGETLFPIFMYSSNASKTFLTNASISMLASAFSWSYIISSTTALKYPSS